MPSTETIDLANHARALYEKSLRSRLEQSNHGDFVAVEPESGDYFLGRAISEAAQAARVAHPDRRSFIIRIGYKVAVEFGAVIA
jgi:hypothetical protein